MLLLLMVACIFSAGAYSQEKTFEELPRWTFTEDMIFPVDRPLMRPEDGVILSNSRLIVSDQAFGLREILPNGSTRPFGRFSEADYVHEPPNSPGGANGVTLEPEGTHILVSDIHHGGIYRVNVDNEETELLYQHAFGVNMARRDKMGGIWFSQSTRNTSEDSESRLFAALGTPLPDGAVYYLPSASNYPDGSALLVADSLYFANGIALDEQAGHLYVAETMGHRVQQFRMDRETGRLTDRKAILEVLTPDNLELDQKGRLWIVSALKSEINTFDLKSGITGSALQVSTPKSRELILEIERRLAADISFLELFVPDLWEPAPGSFTGIILSPDGGPNYITNLGNALIRLEPLSGPETFQEKNPQNVVPIIDEPAHKIRFDNGSARMYEVVLKQGESTLMHEHLTDNFTIFFRTARILAEPYGDREPIIIEAAPGIVGFTSTADGSYSHRVISGGEETFHVIAMELLTPPSANVNHPVSRSGTPFEVVLENNRGRAYRISLAPGESTGSFRRRAGTALFAVSGGRISEAPDGKPSRLWDFETADFRWFDTSETLTIRNESSLAVELVEIEILTDNASMDTALDSPSPVVGTWSLISMDKHFEDGRVEPFMGESPAGRLVYDEAGRMMVYLAGRNRAHFLSPDIRSVSQQELKIAFDTHTSYFGTYSLDEEAGTVTHHIESAWYPNWSGGQQIRFFELEGDRIILGTPPILIDGNKSQIFLTWERLH